MDKKNILNTPEGMKSYLPKKATEFKQIKDKVNQVFEKWGYTPVITPVLEYYDSLLVGVGQKTKKEFYKLIDYDGNILALKPEMTAPIARTVVNRREELSLPLRLSYSSPVFRYDSPQMGKNREIFQMGIEHLGDNLFADAETIIIAIEAIKNAGIDNFKIDLGHVEYLEGIIKELNLFEEQGQELKEYLGEKNFVGFRGYVDNLEIENKALLKEFPLLRGKKDILEKAKKLVNNKISRKAINKLKKIYTYLKGYQVEDYVNFDLSLLRGMDYYTGMIFEGYTEKLGYNVCGGGRYDNLLKKYGEEKIPAVGFALGIQRISLSLENEKEAFAQGKIDGMIVFNFQNRENALNTTKRLHNQGYNIIIREDDSVSEKLISTGKQKRVKKIISFLDYKQTDKIEIIDIETGVKKELKLKEGWEQKIWAN